MDGVTQSLLRCRGGALNAYLSDNDVRWAADKHFSVLPFLD